MSLVTRYRLFWAALMAALLGLAFWKNSQSGSKGFNGQWKRSNLGRSVRAVSPEQIRGGATALQRKLGGVNGPGQEPVDDVSVEDLSRVAQVS
jgi:hypothetical protein